MDFKSYAFISYQTSQKEIAGKLQRILVEVGIKSFLAHEDIGVSEEWRVKILEEIEKTDVFVALLSNDYFQSCWCVQESGIAAYKKGITIIPLSVDGTTPKGFISHIQSARIDPENFDINDLIPGLIRHNFDKGIDLLTEIIRGSSSYRSAESNFKLINPYLARMSDEQVVNLLNKCRENRQVYEATACAVEYIPPLLLSHGRLLEKESYDFLKMQCDNYP
jgi:TIR domain